MAARRSARSTASAAMSSKPRPERTARISMTVSCPASARTDTAMAENASSAPVIQRTTRISCGIAKTGSAKQTLCAVGGAVRPSLRVRLVLRPRLVERHLEASGVCDLRHQADVGQRDLAAERVGAGTEQRLDRLEALEDPVVVP